MSKLSNIKVLMDKTLHHVPKILTTRLIKHKSVKGTKVIQRESLETFNYRRAFYTTTAIIILLSVGIGYGVFVAMNIGLTREEVQANLLNQFNNTNEVADTLDRKDVNPLTYVFNKDLDNNKVYTFTGARNDLLEHDVTSNVYHVEDLTPTSVPTIVKRAYSKEDIEANYIKSVDSVELNGLKTSRERNPNTYILKKNFNEQTVYAFSGLGTETKEHDVTSNVYHIEDNPAEFVPATVKRAYSKQDIENNYVKRLEGNTLLGLETKSEVDPNTYILKNTLNSNQIYTINGAGINREMVESTSSILYKNDNKDENLPQNLNTRGYTKDAIESTYIRPNGIDDLKGLETGDALDPRLYTWDYQFSLDTAYTFSGKILTKEAHIVTDSLYYVTDERPNLVPKDVRRAYLKQDIEKNYVLKSRQQNLDGIDVSYERTELSNDHVYSFSGDSIHKAKDINQITKDVRYVGETRPNNIPSTVTRAYTASEVEENYVLKLGKNNIDGINALKEVDPETYIKKNTLASSIYYHSSGKGNNLKVDSLPINKGEIYQAINKLSNDENLTLELLDLKNKIYINSYDSDENLYVLKHIEPNLLNLKPTNHIKEKIYAVDGDGSDVNFVMSDEEVLTLDNKIALFQKEKVTNAFDRYGNFNWYGIWRWRFNYKASTNCYSHLETHFGLLERVNSYLPLGVDLTQKEKAYLWKNISIGRYKFRVFVGSGLPENKYSYGVVQHPDGREWGGVDRNNLEYGERETLSVSKFPTNAKRKREDYRWSITAAPQHHSFQIENYRSYERELNANKDVTLWVDSKDKSICKSFANKDGSTSDHEAIRGIQVYKNPTYE